MAVAIITDDKQRILITQRPLHVVEGGRWEFPGGKLEPGELPEQALVREIREEVGLEIQEYHVLGEVINNPVQLIIFHVTQFSGTAFCLENQLNLQWEHPENLQHYDFPEANRVILRKILSE